MINKAFDKYLQEKCKVYWAERDYFSSEIAQGKMFFEAGQLTLPADVEKVLEAAREVDRLSLFSTRPSMNKLFKAIRNHDKVRDK